MTTLLLAEVQDGVLLDVTAKALTAAQALGSPVHVLVAGANVGAAAKAAAAYQGIEKVLAADDPALADGLAETVAALLVKLAPAYGAIVAGATASAKNILPRVAALLDVMQVSDVIAIVAPDTFERPVYAGSAIQTVRSSDPIKVVTVRTASFAAAATGDGAVPIEAVSGAADPGLSIFKGAVLAKSERPDLSGAKIIVSGGRAIGNADNFGKILLPLADVLGAAVGASRAAVDAGYAPNDWQVGQTGKIVAPDLYIAVGISGAIQHLAGMKDSRVIVAINQDEEAPILQIADYSLVGDLFAIVPALTEALGKKG